MVRGDGNDDQDVVLYSATGGGCYEHSEVVHILAGLLL